MFAHARSEVVFHAVRVPVRGHLQFGVGIEEAGWQQGGDGAVFALSIRTSQGEEMVFFIRLEPRAVAADRGWIWTDIDLERYARERVDFIFQTDERTNDSYDWCWWADPVVENCAACGGSVHVP